MEDISSLSIAELKKKIKEKEVSLKSNFNPIDKYTKIDDLLRQNIALQRDLIEEQHISNKILLALYIQEGANGEFVAKQPIAGVDTSAILKGLKGGDDYQTLNTLLQNISGDADFLIEGSGIIETIKLVSNSTTIDNKD